MCGIAGRVGVKAHEETEHWKKNLQHRGPDAWGEAELGKAHFLHTRLSIVALDDGAQPFITEDAMLIANGEIYNHQDLRTQLIKNGADFKTQSDCEVLLWGLKFQGVEFLNQVQGMFALAYYQESTDTTILARDRFGQKPLYYHKKEEGLEFASELPALLTSGSKLKCRKNAVEHFLRYSFIPGNQTIFSNIYELKPGHSLIYSANSITEKEIQWKKNNNPTTLAKLFDDSVNKRLMADVPLGVFLSGGLDSMLIAASLKSQGLSPTCFSVSFGNKDFDEASQAADICKHLNLEHKILNIEQNFFDEHDRLVSSFGQPFGDSSAMAVSAMCREAKQYIKVALTGDGADEFFGGYRRYRTVSLMKQFGWVPKAIWSFTESILNKMVTKDTYFANSKLKTALYVSRLLGNTKPENLLFPSPFSKSELNTLLGSHSEYSSPYKNTLSIRRMMDEDINFYLPSDILVKADRASMRWGLEIRNPFLDTHLVDHSFETEERQLISGARQKIILRDLAKEHYNLPEDWIERKKHGFELPITSIFLDNPNRTDNLAENLKDILNPDAVNKCIDSMQNTDSGFRVWLLYAVSKWLEDMKSRNIQIEWV